MSRKARKEASLNYVNVGVSLLSLAIMCVAAIMPFWLIFPMDGYTSFQVRNMGLLKLSGKYTNVMVSGADLTWIEVRDSVCAASNTWVTGQAGTNVMAIGSALGSQMLGASCPPTCKQHLSTRCTMYYKFTSMGFTVFGMLAGGGLASLVGSLMPLIGKERKRDRATWMAVDLVGFLLAAGGCGLHWFIFNSSLNELRLTSWYQKENLGWAFMMAAAGAALLIVPVVVQIMKMAGDGDKKEEKAELLTAGGNPDFVMPSAI